LKLRHKREAYRSNRSWIFGGNCLDIHTSLLGVDAAKTLILAIMEEGQVDLPININCLMNEY